jgi:hypothetical protein
MKPEWLASEEPLRSSAGERVSVAAYRQQSPVTDLGPYADYVEAMPDDLAALATAVQGLIIHHGMGSLYGVTIAPESAADAETLDVQTIVGKIVADDPAPLAEPRAPERRFVGHCRVVAVLYTAFARAKGHAARARAGFSAYFPRFYGDHWVTEIWDGAASRWRLVDAELDPQLIEATHLAFDPLDVPRAAFLFAGDTWQRCRAGEIDPDIVGLDEDNAGMRYIRGQLLRDVAALNGYEPAGSEVWGLGAAADETLTEDDYALLDYAASLSSATDADGAELRRLFECDTRLRHPALGPVRA